MKKTWCVACVLYVALLMTFTAIAQETTPVQTPSEGIPTEILPIVITGGVVGSLHGAKDLNQEIEYFNHDARVVAQALDNLYAINMSLSGRVPDLTMSLGYYGSLLYKPFPSIGAGVEAEFLQIGTQGAVDISTPEVGVQFTLDVTIPTFGVCGVLAFDPSDLFDTGSWIASAQAGFGFYRTNAHSEKRIHLTGIEHFSLRDEVNVSVTESAWGSKASLSVGYQLNPNIILKVVLASRQLVFKNAGINFNDLADTVDLDLSGVCVAASIELRF